MITFGYSLELYLFCGPFWSPKHLIVVAPTYFYHIDSFSNYSPQDFIAFFGISLSLRVSKDLPSGFLVPQAASTSKFAMLFILISLNMCVCVYYICVGPESKPLV